MTSDQPHPQRCCETCKNIPCKPLDRIPCASHSASSQQRIEQVIKELEKLANEEERLKKESKTNEPWMGHAYANSAYLKAIALLREGAP